MKILNILLILSQLTWSQFSYSADNTKQEVEIPKPGLFDVVTKLPEDMSVWWKETFNKENAPLLAGVLKKLIASRPSQITAR
jgi:hypothetical protein